VLVGVVNNTKALVYIVREGSESDLEEERSGNRKTIAKAE